MHIQVRKLFIILLIFSLLLAGCSSPAATPMLPGLTAEMIKNAQYTVNAANAPRTVQLNSGVYETGAGTDFISIQMGEQMAFGDLNGDGMVDAAAVVGENYGGSGDFTYLVVFLNRSGALLDSFATLIGDRPKINALQIDNRQIVLDAVVHGPKDGICCPSFPVLRTYNLNKSGLNWMRQTSKTPDGAERAITIESPANVAQVSGSVRVKGTVSISPFENNLAYKIYDATGKELANGPFSVSSDGAVSPGTFDNPIDLSAIPAGLLVRFELSDVSAADGSTLAMDSLELFMK